MAKKINHQDLPSVVGQTIVVRDNATGAEKRGVVMSQQGNFVMVQQNRSQFYVPINLTVPSYIYAVD